MGTSLRKQQAELEEKKRREREEAESRKRVDTIRSAAAQDLANLQTEISAQGKATYAVFFASNVQEISRQVREVSEGIAGAARLEDVQAFARQAQTISQRLTETIAEAKAKELSEQLRRQMEAQRAEAEVALARIRGMLKSQTESTRNKFDAPGAQKVDRLVAEAQTALGKKRYGEASTLLGAAESAARTHLALVTRQLAAWLDDRDRATARAAELRDRLAAIENDAPAKRWCKEDIAAVAVLAKNVDERISREEWGAISKLVEEADSGIKALLEKAHARQLEADKHQYIVTSIAKVLKKQPGFRVSDPTPLHPADPDSDLVIRGVRTDRRSVTIQVALEGHVQYVVDGFAKRVETRAGHQLSSCDEAEQALQAINDRVAADFGIEMSEITWAGKDPKRIKRGEKDLPGAGPAASKTTGGKS